MSLKMLFVRHLVAYPLLFRIFDGSGNDRPCRRGVSGLRWLGPFLCLPVSAWYRLIVGKMGAGGGRLRVITLCQRWVRGVSVVD